MAFNKLERADDEAVTAYGVVASHDDKAVTAYGVVAGHDDKAVMAYGVVAGHDDKAVMAFQELESYFRGVNYEIVNPKLNVSACSCTTLYFRLA